MAIKNSFSLLLSSLMVFALIAIPTISGQPSGTWCVANPKIQDQVVQAALGWACQQSQAYCSRIQLGQNCYSPNTLRDHASVVFNTYYQHNKDQGGSCDFNRAAVITHTDPSKQLYLNPVVF
ncbi:BnaCnng75660D [Brassica napus]|uniref:BnaCnng75660D protein n=1 Tax=Brassica napus TaxID=3708 RepID=A0A078JZB0_BRANA|nr:BnaCnng75660D [Brassica napus]